ncbi:MAG: FkbM family methyltransferase [Candidatus Scalindua sp.]|nr:FkbM family methyltransferase [Candidatus Scalindua sp.]
MGKNRIGMLYKHTLKFLAEKIPQFYRIIHILPQKRFIDIRVNPTKNRLNVFLFIIKKTIVVIARYNKSKEKIMRKVTYKARMNFILDLDLNEYTQCLYYFEPPNQDLIRLIEKGGSVFVDIGANVGFFSLLGSYTFNNVISFEPTPKSNNALKNHIRLNKINNIQVYDYALSDTKGTMTLYENPYNAGGNRLDKFADEMISKSGRDDWVHYMVDVVTLDEILDDNNQDTISLIKIDVEGHETKVLKGSRHTLSKYRPIIYAEIGGERDRLNSILEVVPEFYKAYDSVNKELIGNNSSLPSDVLLIPAGIEMEAL